MGAIRVENDVVGRQEKLRRKRLIFKSRIKLKIHGNIKDYLFKKKYGSIQKKNKQRDYRILQTVKYHVKYLKYKKLDADN